MPQGSAPICAVLQGFSRGTVASLSQASQCLCRIRLGLGRARPSEGLRRAVSVCSLSAARDRLSAAVAQLGGKLGKGPKPRLL